MKSTVLLLVGYESEPGQAWQQGWHEEVNNVMVIGLHEYCLMLTDRKSTVR